MSFNRKEAVRIIQDELGWKDYGGKHHESVYTRFYQAYILPKKFGIDKRKAHLTCLMISTGEITREQALEELKAPAADPKRMSEDKDYLLKKLGISQAEFDRIMADPIKTINDYPNIQNLEKWFKKLLHILRSLNLASR